MDTPQPTPQDPSHECETEAWKKLDNDQGHMSDMQIQIQQENQQIAYIGKEKEDRNDQLV